MSLKHDILDARLELATVALERKWVAEQPEGPTPEQEDDWRRRTENAWFSTLSPILMVSQEPDAQGSALVKRFAQLSKLDPVSDATIGSPLDALSSRDSPTRVYRQGQEFLADHLARIPKGGIFPYALYPESMVDFQPHGLLNDPFADMDRAVRKAQKQHDPHGEAEVPLAPGGRKNKGDRQREKARQAFREAVASLPVALLKNPAVTEGLAADLGEPYLNALLVRATQADAGGQVTAWFLLSRAYLAATGWRPPDDEEEAARFSRYCKRAVKYRFTPRKPSGSPPPPKPAKPDPPNSYRVAKRVVANAAALEAIGTLLATVYKVCFLNEATRALGKNKRHHLVHILAQELQAQGHSDSVPRDAEGLQVLAAQAAQAYATVLTQHERAEGRNDSWLSTRALGHCALAVTLDVIGADPRAATGIAIIGAHLGVHRPADNSFMLESEPVDVRAFRSLEDLQALLWDVHRRLPDALTLVAEAYPHLSADLAQRTWPDLPHWGLPETPYLTVLDDNPWQKPWQHDLDKQERVKGGGAPAERGLLAQAIWIGRSEVMVQKRFQDAVGDLFRNADAPRSAEQIIAEIDAHPSLPPSAKAFLKDWSRSASTVYGPPFEVLGERTRSVLRRSATYDEYASVLPELVRLSILEHRVTLVEGALLGARLAKWARRTRSPQFSPEDLGLDPTRCVEASA